MDPARLRVSSLFEGLTDGKLERCAARFEEATLTAGSRVVNEGDHAYGFFVILDGEVEVRHDFEQVRRLGAGEFFGELGVLGASRRTAKVVTVTRCRLAKIMSWDFRALLEDHPLIAARIEAVAEQRRRADESAASRGADQRGREPSNQQ